jgi:hypothetical protein
MTTKTRTRVRVPRGARSRRGRERDRRSAYGPSHGIAFVPDAQIPAELLLGDDTLVRVLDAQVGRKLAMWLLAAPKTFELPAIRIIVEQTTRLLAMFE